MHDRPQRSPFRASAGCTFAGESGILLRKPVLPLYPRCEGRSPRMLSRQENELLCRVRPETPMGQMMRRYWLPVAMSTELIAGTPKRIRLLGEMFVAFRGDDGDRKSTRLNSSH